MTKDTKRRLIQAFDILIPIETGHAQPRPDGAKKPLHGWPVPACDVCGDVYKHTPECPVGIALKALSGALPGGQNRDQWIAADTSEQEDLIAALPFNAVAPRT